jgi:hypothetical protein
LAHRTFRDALGRVWEVWPVTVEYMERRADPAGGPITGAERRRRPSFRPRVAPQWKGGWLAFETTGEKRRLAPFPENWSERTDVELERLCAKAVRVAPSRRLIE